MKFKEEMKALFEWQINDFCYKAPEQYNAIVLGYLNRIAENTFKEDDQDKFRVKFKTYMYEHFKDSIKTQEELINRWKDLLRMVLAKEEIPEL